MTSPRPTAAKSARVLQVIGTAVVGILALFAMNTLNSGGDGSASGLSTQSLLTLPGGGASTDPTAVPSPTPFPTTAALQIPTATAVPVPTATAVPATPVPTPEPTPTPVPPTPVPEPQAAPAVEVANAGSVTIESAEPAPAEPAPAEPAPAEPTAEPTVVPPEPEPTPPNPIAAEPTPEPTVEPTPEPTATTVPTDPAALESYVLGEINQVRANAGLGPLALDPNISLVSREWSQNMATGGFFEHRPGAQLDVMLPAGWRKWGENIASAPDIFYAQDSLEASAGHYANMVDPTFTHIGIGVYTTGRQVWVTQNFAQY